MHKNAPHAHEHAHDADEDEDEHEQTLMLMLMLMLTLMLMPPSFLMASKASRRSGEGGSQRGGLHACEISPEHLETRNKPGKEIWENFRSGPPPLATWQPGPPLR